MSIVKSSTELMPHQVRGIEFMLKAKYCINADDMGLGKTLQSLYAAHLTKQKTLIVCPAYLKRNWEINISKFFDATVAVDVTSPKKDVDFYITNYERVGKSMALWGECKTVIFDEAHYLKNMGAKRTQKINHFIQVYRPEYCFLLTGTPVQNRLYEIYNLLWIMDQKWSDFKYLASSEYEFKEKFCKKRFKFFYGKRIAEYYGSRNMGVLAPLLKTRLMRRESKILGFTDPVYYEVTIDYKDDPIMDKVWAHEMKTGTDSKEKALAALNKTDFTIKYVKDLLHKTDHVVVFSDHVKAAEELAKKLKFALIHGGIPTAKRAQIVADFQAGKLTGVVCTIKAAGVGIDLTQANHMVFNDHSWVPGENEQARRRILRIGQDKRCYYHDIYGTLTDRKIIKTVEEKFNDIKKVGL